MDYGDPVPDVTGRDVLILDFSFKRDVMLDLACKAASILCLDHHRTAEAELAGLLFCKFDMNKSGGRLTYEYLQSIDAATNAEIRRVMISRFGFDRYLKESGAVLMQHDDFGRLYRKEIPGEPVMQFVRVVNSTPEPDGTNKEYVLPVRNTVKTAHEAVASSFEISVESYNPSFES